MKPRSIRSHPCRHGVFPSSFLLIPVPTGVQFLESRVESGIPSEAFHLGIPIIFLERTDHSLVELFSSLLVRDGLFGRPDHTREESASATPTHQILTSTSFISILPSICCLSI